MTKLRPYFAYSVLLFLSLLLVLGLAVPPALGDDGKHPYAPQEDQLYLPLVFGLPAPGSLEHWAAGEPDNGASLPEQGWGENCAVLDRAGLLHDIKCESPGHPYVCWNQASGQWYIAKDASGDPKTGIWKQGFDEDCCGEAGFAMPVDSDQWAAMLVDVKDDLAEVGHAWVNGTDLESEGQWVSNRHPWDPVPEEYVYPTWNCAVVLFEPYKDGFWLVQECGKGVYPYLFACRSLTTGEWRATSAGSHNWWDGFELCPKEFGDGWVFDAPLRETSNVRFEAYLQAYLRDHGIKQGELWLNYTDAQQEGVWRHGHWEGWAVPPADAGAGENCALLSEAEGGTTEWSDDGCYEEWPFICSYPDGHLTYETPGFTWHSASAHCQQLGGWLALPVSPTDQVRLASVMPGQGKVWLRYNDIKAEGHWVDWLYFYTKLDAGFSAEPLAGPAPLTVDFTPSVDHPYGHWDFGDGTELEATGVVSHTYQKGDTFTVQYSVEDASGNQGTLTRKDYVKVEPYAYFDCQGYTYPCLDYCSYPLCGAVQCQNQSAGDWDGYRWDFGPVQWYEDDEWVFYDYGCSTDGRVRPVWIALDAWKENNGGSDSHRSYVHFLTVRNAQDVHVAR